MSQEMDLSRRNFVKFLGGASALGLSGGLASCSSLLGQPVPFKAIQPSFDDELTLAEGFNYKIMARWGDAIGLRDTFGVNNDYTAFLPLDGKNNEALFWVNHESPKPYPLRGMVKGAPKTRQQVDDERYSVGGSILHIKKDLRGRWKVDSNSEYGKRITGETPIPLIAEREIAGSLTAEGTFANCAGGVTPWGTVLSCEENYQNFYGEYEHRGTKRLKGNRQWYKHYDNHPYHYGWVVEINLKTAEAKKLTALGRFSHEGATVTQAKDGRVVVYSGDDAKNQHIYKFISNSKDSLEKGELFVANIEKGQWISLDINKHEILKQTFDDQTDVLIHCRKAAKLVGATPCDRPEDIEINPKNGDVFVCLTNNYSKKDMSNPKNNFYGSILKIKETDGDAGSLTFKASDFLVGGENNGFACPDNMIFDKLGNLWLTTDIDDGLIGKEPFKKFGNNGLFYIPMSGSHMGKVFQIASAPKDAEFTGLSLANDGKTVFTAVQHPGRQSKSLSELTSHWPDGGESRPYSAVVQIYGPGLEKIMEA